MSFPTFSPLEEAEVVAEVVVVEAHDVQQQAPLSVPGALLETELVALVLSPELLLLSVFVLRRANSEIAVLALLELSAALLSQEERVVRGCFQGCF